jgi:hypothetical protein
VWYFLYEPDGRVRTHGGHTVIKKHHKQSISDVRVLLVVAPRVVFGVMKAYLRINYTIPPLPAWWRTETEKRNSLTRSTLLSSCRFETSKDTIYKQYSLKNSLPQSGLLEPEVNPVKKVLLVVTGVDADVHIDEINDMDVDGGVDNAAAAQTRARNLPDANFRALYSQLTASRREVQELRGQLEHFEERTARQFGLVNNSIRRIAIQPARRRAVVNNNDNKAAPPVDENEDGRITLSPNPRDLHSLWQEYEFGIGGRKAARLFTAAERGRVKYTYHRRKVVWDQVALMIRAGHTAQTAIDRICEVHGVNRSVTQIINRMRRDRSTGGNPLLNV